MNNIRDVLLESVPEVELSVVISYESVANHVDLERDRSIGIIEDVCFVRFKKSGDFVYVRERGRNRNKT
jgi:hypothetical protein